MPSTPEDLEWIDITDFTPGMTSTTDPAIAASSADGAAERAIYCLPGPSGVGLVPAPALTQSYAYKTTGVATGGGLAAGGTGSPTGGVVLDAVCMGVPVGKAYQYGFPGSSRNDAKLFPVEDELAILSQWYNLIPAGFAHRKITRVDMRHIAGSVISDSIAGSGLPWTTSLTTPSTNGAFITSTLDYGPGSLSALMVKGASSYTPAFSMLAASDDRMYDAGVSVDSYQQSTGQAWCWGGGSLFRPGWAIVSSMDNGGVGIWGNFKPPAPFGSALDTELNARSNPYLAFSHQGRGVLAVSNFGKFADYGATAGNDGQNVDVQAAQSLRFSIIGGGHLPTNYTGFLDIYEPIGGIAVACSLSSDDLFVLGHTGGGVRIRGPLDATPQITRHPMLPGGYGRATHITPTPVGLVWGTRNGVWLWNGGDTAENIAPQLSYDFWWDEVAMGRLAYQQPKGRPVCSFPYLFFPNGWICDLRFKSWFRFGRQISELGSSYPAWWTLAANGDVFGVHPIMLHSTSASSTAYTSITRYDPTQFHTSWFWRSQPLAKSRNRVLNVRELAFTFHNPSGVCAVTITLDGADPADGTIVSQTENITLPASARTQVIRVETNLEVAEAQIEINCVATVTAPSLHRISVGYVSGRSVKRY